MRFCEKWMGSLTAKLLVSCLMTLLFTAGLLASLQFLSATVFVERWTNHIADEEVDAIKGNTVIDAAGKPSAVALKGESAWLYTAMPMELTYRIVDRLGNVLFSAAPGGTALAPESQPFSPEPSRFPLKLNGVDLQVTTTPIAGSNPPYYVQVAVSQRLAKLTQFGLGVRYLAGTGINAFLSLLAFTAVIILTVRRALRPLAQASKAAEEIAPGNLAGRVSTANMPFELVPLFGAFNLALDRLETGFKVQQRFLATAAHELKTPLSLIRGQIELDEIQDKTVLLQDIDVMARQVQQLLHLAEVSEPNNFTFAPTDRVAAATEVVRFLDRLAERHSVRLELMAREGLSPVEADRGAVFVLLKNLIENAIFHSPTAGTVRVHVDAGEYLIEDEGAGFPLDYLGKLFTPFWRGGDRQAPGAGLGLAICREIANAHGWRLNAENGRRGARFTVAFHATAVRTPMRSVAFGAMGGLMPGGAG